MLLQHVRIVESLILHALRIQPYVIGCYDDWSAFRIAFECVASQPCLICGRQPAGPHHLRFAQPRAIGMKVSDEFTVPLCRSHHRNLHQSSNEPRWWENFRIEPLPIARKLWETTHLKAVPNRPPGALDAPESS